MRIVGFGLLGLLVIAAIATGLGQSGTAEQRARATSAALTPNPPQVTPGGSGGTRSVEAFNVCKDEVMPQRLSVRGTAKIPGYAESSVRYEFSRDSYTVTSYVDTLNIYGKQIRATYTCEVSPRGPYWGLVGAELKE